MKLHWGNLCEKGYKTWTVFAVMAIIGFIGTLVGRIWFHMFPPKEHTPEWVALFFGVIVMTILFMKGLIGHFVYIYIHREECIKEKQQNI